LFVLFCFVLFCFVGDHCIQLEAQACSSPNAAENDKEDRAKEHKALDPVDQDRRPSGFASLRGKGIDQTASADHR